MISKIGFTPAHSPSFGFAKLNDKGRATAEKFGLPSNDFLNNDLFKKQGIFRKSAMESELSSGKTFSQICEEYGCSPQGSSNASFIKTQILSKKGTKAIKKVPADDLKKGFAILYMANYDNPQLSNETTRELLEKIKDYMAPEQYVKHVGLLDCGTDKK